MLDKMPQVVILCGSHINNFERLHNFQMMLDSVKAQYLKIPLFVSLSTIDELKTSVMNLISQYPKFTFYTHLHKYSQFEHYAFLAKSLGQSQNVDDIWCMFSDDDDISHPSRSLRYYNHIMYIFNTKNTQIDVVANTSVSVKYLYSHKTPDEAITFYGKSSEYIINACKLKILQEFCQKAGIPLLSHTGCDLAFAKWLKQKTRKEFHCRQWLYEYTLRQGGSHECVGKDLKDILQKSGVYSATFLLK